MKKFCIICADGTHATSSPYGVSVCETHEKALSKDIPGYGLNVHPLTDAALDVGADRYRNLEGKVGRLPARKAVAEEMLDAFVMTARIFCAITAGVTREMPRDESIDFYDLGDEIIDARTREPVRPPEGEEAGHA